MNSSSERSSRNKSYTNKFRPYFALATCSSLLLTACPGAQRETDSKIPKMQTEPFLSANPNPVPAGDLDQPLGTTVITWDTKTEAAGDLCVRVNRSGDTFVGRGATGKIRIDWIQFDSNYEFRLYADKKRRKLLSKLDVTRAN
jgi:hypothetical protein